MSICGVDFNETNWGWDTCDLESNHKGRHYDSVSKHYGENYAEPAKKKHKRPLWMK